MIYMIIFPLVTSWQALSLWCRDQKPEDNETKKQEDPHNFLVNCLIELLPKDDRLWTGYGFVDAGFYEP